MATKWSLESPWIHPLLNRCVLHKETAGSSVFPRESRAMNQKRRSLLHQFLSKPVALEAGFVLGETSVPQAVPAVLWSREPAGCSVHDTPS